MLFTGWCRVFHIKHDNNCLYRLIDRDLVQWDGGADSGEHCILEDSKDQKSFDQFKGTNSTFKWDTYTSKLDPSKSRYSVAEATRIAGEIEGEEPKSDAHVTSEQRYRTAPDDSGVGTNCLSRTDYIRSTVVRNKGFSSYFNFLVLSV